MSRNSDELKDKDDRNEPSVAEKASILMSVLLTVAIFGSTVYMGATAPDRPDVGVHVVRMEQKGDAMHVHVEVTNRGQTGYGSVTVAVDCQDPAPSVTIPNLAASGSKPAVVVCPSNTTAPTAKLVSLVPA